MGAPIVHFEILGKDGKQLQDFYGKLFDWQIDANNPMNYGIVSGSTLGGGVGPNPDGTGWVTVYAQVPDLQATLDKAVQMGAKVHMPPTEIPGFVTMAIFTDPGGNKIGLIKG